MASRPLSDRVPALLFALAVLTSLPIAWVYAVPIFTFASTEHAAHHAIVYVHAIGGVAMLGLGAAALYIGWTRRAFRRHRWFGYGYLLVGGLGAAAALVLSVLASHEPHSLYVATGALAAAWLAVACMAWRAAHNRRFDSHRDWMVRSYVLSWTFVGCRMANVLSLFPALRGEAVTAQIWLFWVIPYLLCEMALQWRRGSPGMSSLRDRALAPQAIE
jgi:hypothetical protein